MQNLLIFLLISAAIESRQVLFDQLPGQLTDAQTANLKDLYDRFMITMNPFDDDIHDESQPIAGTDGFMDELFF